jgi:hypothetical protein
MKLSIDTVLRAVASEFGVTVEQLRGQRRMRNLVVPRQAAFLLAYEFTGASSPVIGRVIGKRDHTTVLYGMRSIRDRMAHSPTLNAKMAWLRDELSRRAGEEPPNQAELAVIGICADLSRALVSRARKGGVTPERLSELLSQVEGWP